MNKYFTFHEKFKIARRYFAAQNLFRMKSVLTYDGLQDPFGHSGQAALYAKFRPDYDAGIIDSVLSRVTGRNSFLDVACGSGQLTIQIAPHFKNAIGVDRSYQQLQEAKILNNIKYISGSAFDLPVESASVDLVTVAQGLHWLTPYSTFFAEVNRVLKPFGTFTALGYRVPRLIHNDLQDKFRVFYFDLLGSSKLPGENGCYWDISRPSLDSDYSDIEFPFQKSLQR